MNLARKAILALLPLTINLVGGDLVQANEKPCALALEVFGDVTFVEESGAKVLNVPTPSRAKPSALPCGSWVSTREGHAVIEHRSQAQVRIAPNSFVQLNDFKTDALVLYRGKIWTDVPDGAPEFRVRTSNTRIRNSGGRFVALYTAADETTQLIGIRGKSWISNYHLKVPNSRGTGLEERLIPVAAGEASSLSLRIKRVVPSTPRALKVSSLRTILEDLPLNDEDLREALVAANDRGERPFAALLRGPRGGVSKPEGAPEQPARELAAKPAPDDKRYERHHIPSDKKLTDAKAYRDWTAKLTGGAESSEKILFPNSGTPTEGTERTPAKETVADPGLLFDVKEQKIIDQERERIITELKKIQHQDGGTEGGQ